MNYRWMVLHLRLHAETTLVAPEVDEVVWVSSVLEDGTTPEEWVRIAKYHLDKWLAAQGGTHDRLVDGLQGHEGAGDGQP